MVYFTPATNHPMKKSTQVRKNEKNSAISAPLLYNVTFSASVSRFCHTFYDIIEETIDNSMVLLNEVIQVKHYLSKDTCIIEKKHYSVLIRFVQSWEDSFWNDDKPEQKILSDSARISVGILLFKAYNEITANKC